MDYLRRDVAGPAHTYPLEGYCAPRFRAVADRFADNLAAGCETGASVAVTLHGELVVDLWGGYRDAAGSQPWRHDTIVNTMAVTKAAGAICVFMLVERGLLDPAAPVARWWPEFAAGGKAELPLQYVLDHRAGLPWIAERLPRGSAYDAHLMAGALARQTPLFVPGDGGPAHHVLSQGYILAEVVRRVTGDSLGEFFRREIATPLHVDFHIGLAPVEIERCATFIIPPGSALRAALDTADDPEAAYWAQLAAGEDFNSLEFRTAQIPAVSGHGNARAVARLYGALCGSAGDGPLLRRATLEQMIAEQHHLPDRIRSRQYHQASGVLRNSPPVAFMGPNPRAFGHQGFGGAIGFGDPDAGIGFGYTMNLAATGDEAARRAPLIEAVFASL